MANNQGAPVLPAEISAAAARAETDRVLQWLDEGGDINARCATDEGGGGSTLFYACVARSRPVTERHVALARELVTRGADVNIQEWDVDFGGRAPLHSVLERYNDPEAQIALDMLALILEAPGANLNVRNYERVAAEGDTPLCYAIGETPSELRVTFVTTLLRAGVSLDGCRRWPGLDEKTAEDVLQAVDSSWTLRVPVDAIELIQYESPHLRRMTTHWRGVVHRIERRTRVTLE